MNTRRCGLKITRIELLIIVAVSSILFSVGVLWMSKPKYRRGAIPCSQRLSRLGDAINQVGVQFVPDNTVSLNSLISFSNVLRDPLFLVCPNSKKNPASSWSNIGSANISYFYRLPFKPEQDGIMMGDDDIIKDRSANLLHGSAIASDIVRDGRHGKQALILMSDGSVRSVSLLALGEMFKQRDLSNRFVFP